MIKGLIFDNYKVLVVSPGESVPGVVTARQSIAARLGITVPELNNAIYQGEHSLEAYVGKISTEQAWQRLFTQYRQPMPTMVEAQQIDEQYWWGDGQPSYNEELVAVIRNLAAEYQTAILSNAWDDIHGEWQKSKFDKSVFKHFFISHEVGLCKPDPRFFQYALQKMQLAPHEVIFTDDNLKNVETSRQLGMLAVQYQNFSQWQAEFLDLL